MPETGIGTVPGEDLIVDTGCWILDAGCAGIEIWGLGFDCYSMLSEVEACH